MRLFWAAVLSCLSCAESYFVRLIDAGPLVSGASVTLVATIFDHYGSIPSEKFRFDWKDNDVPPHSAQFEGNISNSTWSVTYDSSGPGVYEVEVEVSLYQQLSWRKVASRRTTVNVTDFLNGDIKFYHNGSPTDNKFVSSRMYVESRVELNMPDHIYVTSLYDKIQTHWFLNNTFMKSSNELSYTAGYGKYLDKRVTVSAFVIASKPKKNSIPDIRISGRFQQQANVRAELKDVRARVNWLAQDDMYNVTVTCSGSSPLWYCLKILPGKYNVTGKETCLKKTEIQDCSIKVLQNFSEPDEYTLLFIIENEISQSFKPVRIIYRGNTAFNDRPEVDFTAV